MALQRNNPALTIQAAATVTEYRLITPAGIHAVVSTTDDVVGVAQEPAVSGGQIPVRLRSAGTCKLCVDGAIAVGGLVYKAAAGKGSPTSTSSVAIGRALQASAADGDIIEVQLY